MGVGVGVMALLYRLAPHLSAATGPASVVVKLASQHEPIRQVARGYRFYEREVGVYQHPGTGAVAALTRPATTPRHDPESDDFVAGHGGPVRSRACATRSTVARSTTPTAVVEPAGRAARAVVRQRAAARLPVHRAPQRSAVPAVPRPGHQGRLARVPRALRRPRARRPAPRRRAVVRDRPGPDGGDGQPPLDARPRRRAARQHLLRSLRARRATGMRIVDWQICYRNQGAFDLAYFLCQSLDRRGPPRPRVRDAAPLPRAPAGRRRAPTTASTSCSRTTAARCCSASATR